MTSNAFILAGDIGGTKTHLGLFQKGKHRPVLRALETYESREAPGLTHLIGTFLNQHPATVKRACFGVAGPVFDGRSKTTNLPWQVSEREIQKRFGWKRVHLVNDLTATALSLPLLRGKELFSLNRIRVKKGRNMALVAPGTGLGHALLIYRKGGYMPVPSEGGHVEFAPVNGEQIRLLRYLQARYGHVSNERVVSGPGLVRIYNWLKDSGTYPEPAWLREAMAAEDPAKVVAENALAGKHPLCTAALQMFVSVLGAVAGNLALTGLATGGVYLGGGIPPKILPTLRSPLFFEGFTGKGRFRELLERTAVRVILNERAALLGAARGALQRA